MTTAFEDFELTEELPSLHRELSAQVYRDPERYRQELERLFRRHWLLACLLRHQGDVLTRAELLEAVWGRGYTGHAQVVETYVSYLRRKLHRLGPPLIHTRRGVGYLLRGQDPDAAGLGRPDLAGPDLAGG